jgi:hypothetical protein
VAFEGGVAGHGEDIILSSIMPNEILNVLSYTADAEFQSLKI